MKYFIYCRRSSDREDRQTLSIEAQLRELQTLAQREGLEVVDTIIESQSAYKIGRPSFNSMLERIELAQADGIIVWQPNRLARNSKDGGNLIYMMDEGKLKEIRTVTKVFDSSANDKFFLQLEFGMAKKSSDDTSDYMKRDARSKLLKGEWTGVAPVGYLNIDAEGKIAGKFYDHEKQTKLIELGRPLRRIEKDPILAPFMRQFFEYCISEYRTLKEAAAFMNSLGMKSPRYRTKYSISMVEKILKNPFYTGQLRYEGELFPAVHDPIISKKEFETITDRFVARSHPKVVSYEFVYRGLVHCAECGGAIVGVHKIKPSGKEYEYYTCSKRKGACAQKPLKPAEIDRQVEERLRAVEIDDRVWELCKKLLRLHHGEQVESLVSIREKWQKDLNNVDKRASALLELYISGSLEKEEYTKKKNELLEEKALLTEKLNDSGQTTTDWLQQTENFFGSAHAAYETFKSPNTTIARKKQVLQDIGWNLELFDGKLNWEYKMPFNILAERKSEFVSVGTPILGEGKKKNASALAEAAFWRAGRDLNPRSSP